MRKAILVVSFGTSFEESLENSVAALERDIASAFPDCDVFRAFTSGIIRNKLRERGIHISDLNDTINNLLQYGYRELFIQPTHIINGIEFDKIKKTAEAFSGKFDLLRVGIPLLHSSDDMQKICRFFSAEFGNEKALAFMGHGTSHAANRLYETFGETCRQLGYKNMFIGTVEGTPDADDVIDGIKQAGYSRVIITPLMLVAGDHANNDMAGDNPESWKSRFEAAGLKTECVIKGLGEYSAVRKIYIEHLNNMLFSS